MYKCVKKALGLTEWCACRLEDSVRGALLFPLGGYGVYAYELCSFTPSQRALNQTKWKEYFSGGRKYYYNVSLSTSFILFYSPTHSPIRSPIRNHNSQQRSLNVKRTGRYERIQMGHARRTPPSPRESRERRRGSQDTRVRPLPLLPLLPLTLLPSIAPQTP